jgi:hypothetical protein
LTAHVQTISIPAVPGTELRIIVTADPTSTVNGMLAEISKRNPLVRQAFDALATMGYQPGIPEIRADKDREPYLTWTDPARPGRPLYALYLTGQVLTTSLTGDRAQAVTLPGARVRSKDVAWRISTPAELAQALDAARALKHPAS